MTALPKVGDQAILYPGGGGMPGPVTVTEVKDGKITGVKLGGPWIPYVPDEFTVEGWAPEDWKDCVVLFDRDGHS